MNRNEIERLKNKNYVRAFGLMSKEEQEVLEKAGGSNCLVFDGKYWFSMNHYSTDKKFHTDRTYAIISDYQPEPEYVDLEIVKHTEVSNEPFWWLGVWKNADGKRYDFLPFEFTHLHCLPSLPGFVGFTEEDMLGCLVIEKVASKISEGKTVFARFRK